MLDNYIIDPITGEGHFELANTTQAKNAYLREAEFRNTDWFDLLFNSNVMQNHAVSISGGTDKGSFYTSASVMTDPGWYKSSSVERYTFNANALYNLSSRVRVKLLTSDSFRKQKAPGTISQQTDVVNGEVSRSFDINPFSLKTCRCLSLCLLDSSHSQRNSTAVCWCQHLAKTITVDSIFATVVTTWR